MGWSYNVAKFYKKNGQVDRKAELDDVLTWTSTSGIRREVLKSVMVGKVYYAAIRRTGPDGDSCVYAYVADTHVNSRDEYNFGYKDMPEDYGPCFYDCPESILSLLTPTTDECSLEWRSECWARIERTKSAEQYVVVNSELIERYLVRVSSHRALFDGRIKEARRYSSRKSAERAAAYVLQHFKQVSNVRVESVNA